MLKAIETVYNGYRFRSRLEARWAVFFDTAGVKWEYEKEGFDLDGMWYLPDFWLPELDCWTEIKGAWPTTEDWEKTARLTEQSKKPTAVIVGNIDINNPGIYVNRPMPDGIARVSWKDRWSECPLCNRVEITLHGLWSELSCRCHKRYYTETKPKILKDSMGIMSLFHSTEDEKHKMLVEGMQAIEEEAKSSQCYNSPRLIAAYTAARQARFEHGETPRVKYEIPPPKATATRMDPHSKAPVEVEVDPDDPHLVAQEYASSIDRQYFKDHPGEKSYTRKYIENEGPIQEIARSMKKDPMLAGIDEKEWEYVPTEVEVTQIKPGFRSRVLKGGFIAFLSPQAAEKAHENELKIQASSLTTDIKMQSSPMQTNKAKKKPGKRARKNRVRV